MWRNGANIDAAGATVQPADCGPISATLRYVHEHTRYRSGRALDRHAGARTAAVAYPSNTVLPLLRRSDPGCHPGAEVLHGQLPSAGEHGPPPCTHAGAAAPWLGWGSASPRCS